MFRNCFYKKQKKQELIYLVYDFKQQSIPPSIETISLSKLPKRLQQLKTSVHINKFTYHKQESTALSLFYNLS